LRGPSDLGPGVGLAAGTDAGGGPGGAETEIKEDAHCPGNHASYQGKRQEETQKAAAHHTAAPPLRELLRLRARHDSEFEEQATGRAPACTVRWVNVTTGTAHPHLFYWSHLPSPPAHAETFCLLTGDFSWVTR